ncbi:MAG: hypothetical protein ABIH20_05350 [Candidatus Diapherotrites archaeon]
MNKSIIILFILVSVLLSGCTEQPQENGQNNGTTIDDSSGLAPELTDTSASENDIASLDIEILELESMIEDSEFSEEDFIKLDESTFE